MPDAWIDVTHMHDLADVASDFRARHGRWLRVATKYITITRQHFAKAGIAEYRIVESLGATEAAPASGVADIIVDITTTGSTLTANALRVLEDGALLQSQACLIVSRTATWTPGRQAQLEHHPLPSRRNDRYLNWLDWFFPNASPATALHLPLDGGGWEGVCRAPISWLSSPTLDHSRQEGGCRLHI